MPYKARPIATRFWEKVDRSGDCWNWIGARHTASGYGSFAVRKGDIRPAHRVSFELAYGPIPKGLSVLHRCDNPACVRPEHLFAGSQRENMLDMRAKGRWRYSPRDQFGENNPNAVLSDADVASMLAELAAGGRPVSVARKYGISYKTLWAIRRRKR